METMGILISLFLPVWMMLLMIGNVKWNKKKDKKEDQLGLGVVLRAAILMTLLSSSFVWGCIECFKILWSRS